MAQKQIIDGCTAAAHVAFALSEVATIYPITPIASMGETAQKWALAGRKNIFGQPLEIKEMESELGAAGAVHGALAAGALATTFTASQGLMLMIPNMYKIAGELLPGVFHVGCRSLATHALSIFGDHQDVMACRATGFTMLVSASVQETMDLALVAHLAAIEGSLPVLHFFDGWRTSGELDTIDVIDYETMRPLVNMEKVEAFRRKGMNPEHPRLRGSAQNSDIYFQNTEARNRYYDAFPAVVQEAMDKVASVTGRQYHLVDYAGAPDAEQVLVIMGSGAAVAEEAVRYINETEGGKTGVVKIRLYRPFPADEFIKALPQTVKTVAVLDRTKEFGAQHEPLCQDVITAIHTSGRDIRVIGGRFGLSSKNFDPAMVKAVLDEAAKPDAKQVFTVGIDDDVTHLSLNCPKDFHTYIDKDTYQSVFYGIGADGTVGGTKQVAAIIGNGSDLYAQAYFSYSAKKSGGYTVSELRIGRKPITSAYSIEYADYVGCHKPTYVDRFRMLDNAREGGVFVLNSPWTDAEMETKLPARMRRQIAEKKLRFYNIDADGIARSVGLGVRINMPMETVFLYLSGTVPFENALNDLKEQIRKTYAHEGGAVVNKNLKAVDMAAGALREVKYPDSWLTASDEPADQAAIDVLPSFIRDIHRPCMERLGDSVPVSVIPPDGTMPMGTTAYEKRRIALMVPHWNPDKCVECTECSLVCPHAAIRPFVLTPEEKAAAPEGFVTKDATGAPELKGYQFRIQNFTEDCMGCASCVLTCPGHALSMKPIAEELPVQVPLLEWAQKNVSCKDNLVSPFTVNGSQLQTPCLQFSGACAGCGETPYVKLLTQLFGKHLLIANATGCSSVWGADYPSNPYCTTPDGRGPAWGNSLFEDNGEYGFGMLVATRHRRALAALRVKELIDDPAVAEYLKYPLEAWINAKDDPVESERTGRMLVEMLTPVKNTDRRFANLLGMADMLAYRSVWAIGGDGWAYDIGFAGLDHVLASGEPIKILVMDTECYSNTGGQTSKATPRSAVAKYSPDGKPNAKKDLARMMMTYGNIYVASIALGANFQQAIDALTEAENYPGPAIVIAYCPCINHGIRLGLGHSILEERKAVASGYWPIYRYDPRRENPLTLDSAAPDGSLSDYINGEDRYADLRMTDPRMAAILQPLLEQDCDKTYQILKTRTKYGAE